MLNFRSVHFVVLLMMATVSVAHTAELPTQQSAQFSKHQHAQAVVPQFRSAMPVILGSPIPLHIQPPSGSSGRNLGNDMECLVEPYRVSGVGSAVEGTLAEVLVDRGDNVHLGQVVARLNASVESATVALRAAQEEYGRRKMERNEELFQKELISASDKDELETQTRIAALEHKQQQEVLALRTITSPLNGVVIERYLSPGERVGNEKILKIAQIDPLHVEVVVPVNLFGKLKVGSVGQVSFSPLITGVYTAKVSVVDRVIDAASGTFGVRLVMSNPGNRIPAGIKCKVRFQSPKNVKK